MIPKMFKTIAISNHLYKISAINLMSEIRDTILYQEQQSTYLQKFLFENSELWEFDHFKSTDLI